MFVLCPYLHIRSGLSTKVLVVKDRDLFINDRHCYTDHNRSQLGEYTFITLGLLGFLSP